MCITTLTTMKTHNLNLLSIITTFLLVSAASGNNHFLRVVKFKMSNARNAGMRDGTAYGALAFTGGEFNLRLCLPGGIRVSMLSSNEEVYDKIDRN